jgi:hypothetical protein
VISTRQSIHARHSEHIDQTYSNRHWTTLMQKAVKSYSVARLHEHQMSVPVYRVGLTCILITPPWQTNGAEPRTPKTWNDTVYGLSVPIDHARHRQTMDLFR